MVGHQPDDVLIGIDHRQVMDSAGFDLLPGHRQRISICRVSTTSVMMSLTIVFGMVVVEPRAHRAAAPNPLQECCPVAVLSAAFTCARLAGVPRPASSKPTKIDVVQELPVAVVVTDHAGRLVDFNGAAVELLEHPREVCLGRTLVSFVDCQPFEGDGPAEPPAGTTVFPAEPGWSYWTARFARLKRRGARWRTAASSTSCMM